MNSSLDLPLAISAEILRFLSLPEIGRSAQVCKYWNEASKYAINTLAADISLGRELKPIPCVNTVDYEKFPKLMYIKTNIAGNGVKQEMVDGKSYYSCTADGAGCICYPTCTDEDTCTCIQGMNYRKAFDDNKRLVPRAPKRKFSEIQGQNEEEEEEEEDDEEAVGIFECNRDCGCTFKCTNRVLQLGIQIRLQVFKTPQKAWGLRTLDPVLSGTFVCEYVGEVINTIEAMKRQVKYDSLGLNYLMVIKEFTSNAILRTNIDSTYFGNVARVINHSCDPNLQTVLIRVDSLIPRVGFFARRNIKENAELTFDYGSMGHENIGSNYACHCGTEKCKKFLPFNPYV